MPGVGVERTVAASFASRQVVEGGPGGRIRRVAGDQAAVSLRVVAFETGVIEDAAGRTRAQGGRDGAAVGVVEPRAGCGRKGEGARVGEIETGDRSGWPVQRVCGSAVGDVVDPVQVVVERRQRGEADPLLVDAAGREQKRAGPGALVDRQESAVRTRVAESYAV